MWSSGGCGWGRKWNAGKIEQILANTFQRFVWISNLFIQSNHTKYPIRNYSSGKLRKKIWKWCFANMFHVTFQLWLSPINIFFHHIFLYFSILILTTPGIVCLFGLDFDLSSGPSLTFSCNSCGRHFRKNSRLLARVKGTSKRQQGYTHLLSYNWE